MMNPHDFRNLILAMEARLPDTEYEETSNEVIARLKSYNSQVYTKLAQKVERMKQLESEISILKEEVKAETRENIADLFDAEDATKTRVVETVSLILTLSKDPKATESPKYKEILNELEKHLTPELIVVLENLKKTMVTVTQKSPSLRINTMKESFGGQMFARLKDIVMNWANRYDQKLDALKQKASM